MKKLVSILVLILCTPVFAVTLLERKQQLEAAPGVIVAVIQVDAQGLTLLEPLPIFEGYSKASISYLYEVNGALIENTVAVIVEEATGDTWWGRQVPAIIPVTPVTYFGAKQITAAQIKTYADNKWTTANPGSTEIKEFSVESIDSNTVRITGAFDVAGTRERRAYLIWLVDPLGALSGANVKFEREIQP